MHSRVCIFPRPVIMLKNNLMKQIVLLVLVLTTVILTACNSQGKLQQPTASLTNTYWKLSEMNGKPVRTPENAKEVHIKFVGDGKRLQGFAGCNGVGGNYTLGKNNKINMRMISTQMYCERMEVENFLSDAVTKADNYRIEGEKLFLMQGKKPLAQFESVYF
jgi:heat shock protein HslJ